MMNKKQLLCGVLLAGLLGFGCSHTGQFSQQPKSFHNNPSSKFRSFDVPIEMNDRVLAWVDYFQGTSKDRFERYLQRSGRYVTWMRGILKEEGLPQDLVYLALIESGFSNQAYSRAKASGPWQFMRRTGNHYGLSTNGWQDERRDPEKATRAAAQYLKKLYNDFGNWYLAMAAYNAGEGRIYRAIQKSGTRDFWKITAPGTRYLKPETKDYVPKFIAAALIAKNPEHYGFRGVAYHDPIAYDEVEVEGPIDLEVAGRLVATDADQMAFLNPELHRHITPPHSYKLKVPQGTKGQFEVAYAQLPPEERVLMVTHKVRKGESLGSIARRYGVSSKVLISANGIHGKRPRVTSGMILTIPKGKAALVVADAEKETRRYSHKVKKNESLKSIASKFGVSVAQLKKENHLRSNSVRAGQRLRITKTSTLSTGDMLAYNKKTKNVRMNGVEYLIRKQQNMGGTEDVVVSDSTEKKEVADVEENVTPESVSVDVASATPTPGIEESDLPESEGVVVIPPKNADKKNVKASAVKKHLVKRGESLIKIAKKYQVSVSDLQEWNHLKNTKAIRVGQSLTIRQPAIQTKKEKVKNVTTPVNNESAEVLVPSDISEENSAEAEAGKPQDDF